MKTWAIGRHGGTLKKWGTVLLVVSAISLAISVGASGLDYMEWERDGAHGAAKTPDWIVGWHLVSLIGIGLGISLLIGACITHLNQRKRLAPR